MVKVTSQHRVKASAVQFIMLLGGAEMTALWN
jgi:hypothetical protein